MEVAKVVGLLAAIVILGTAMSQAATVALSMFFSP